jgi:hypothetical protein
VRLWKVCARAACAGTLAGLYVLSLAYSAHASGIETLVEKIPRSYIGDFIWDRDKQAQNLAIQFNDIRALSDDKAEAVGCGVYEINGRVTDIKVRMFIRLRDLQIEMWESARDAGPNFQTDGSHVGKLSAGFQSIDATWTTRLTGQHGQLHLQAAPHAECSAAVGT